MLLTRIKTGFLLLFACLLFLGLSHIPAVMLAVIGALGALTMIELAEPLKLSKWPMAVVGAVLALTVCALNRTWMTVVLGLLFFGYLLASWGMMVGLPEKNTFSFLERLLIPAAVAAFLGTIFALRQMEMGVYTLMLPMLVCAATDTFAYFVGRHIGKQPLAPHISPKKTLEGAIGGGVLATVLVVLLGVCLEWAGLAQVQMDLLVLYVLTASAVGQFGDLCLSAVKRVAGAKDFSNVLPGHGGILDRMDSCLLALPFTYLFIGCFGPIVS